MHRRPPRSTRTDTLFPTRRSSDLTIFQVIGRIDPVRLIAIRDHAVIVVLDRLVLGPHEAALDIERTVDVDADENARHRPVLGREDRRPRHYGADLLVDRGSARLDLVVNVGLDRPFVPSPGRFPPERPEPR